MASPLPRPVGPITEPHLRSQGRRDAVPRSHERRSPAGRVDRSDAAAVDRRQLGRGLVRHDRSAEAHHARRLSQGAQPAGAPPLGRSAARLGRPGGGSPVGRRDDQRGPQPEVDPQHRLGLRPRARPGPGRGRTQGQPGPPHPAPPLDPHRAALPDRRAGCRPRGRDARRIPVPRPARRLHRAPARRAVRTGCSAGSGIRPMA